MYDDTQLVNSFNSQQEEGYAVDHDTEMKELNDEIEEETIISTKTE